MYTCVYQEAAVPPHNRVGARQLPQPPAINRTNNVPRARQGLSLYEKAYFAHPTFPCITGGVSVPEVRVGAELVRVTAPVALLSAQSSHRERKFQWGALKRWLRCGERHLGLLVWREGPTTEAT